MLIVSFDIVKCIYHGRRFVKSMSPEYGGVNRIGREIDAEHRSIANYGNPHNLSFVIPAL